MASALQFALSCVAPICLLAAAILLHHQVCTTLFCGWRGLLINSMSQEKLKVLLIEHDPGFARALGEMLGQARDLPADLRAAPNLNAGLSVLSGGRFDVV